MKPPNSDSILPCVEDVSRAAERLRGLVHHTPVVTCESIDRVAGASLFFKCENLQKVGAFKYRGATNALRSLPAHGMTAGVATHSSGNHAAALARAAAALGVPAYIVMPRNAPAVKRAAVAGYGGTIILCDPTLEARESTLRQLVAEKGLVVVHPYNDRAVIAGQGTCALELLEQIPALDLVIAPVGGGGLLSGTALAVRGINPRVQVVGAEPMGADDAYRSLRAGAIIPSVRPQTIADGLLTSLGPLTFALIRHHVSCIVTVSEEAIVHAMRMFWERAKLLIEPSAAVPLAAVLERKVAVQGLRVGIILSGGNVDLDALPWGQGSR